MFSLSPPMRASIGSSYFDKEDYYTGSPEASKWYGAGAEALDLSGLVNREDFKSILRGFDPRTNEPLTRNAGDDLEDEDEEETHSKDQDEAEGDKKDEKERRSYWDGTFSVPKSVSILLEAAHSKPEVSRQIEAAHNRAVEAVIKKIEAEYAYTRQASPGGGTMETVKTSNLVMARFNHYLSREKDPQLHSHIVIANLTQGADGTWRTLEPKKIYQDQKYIGQVYRNELAANMKKLKYKILADPPSKPKGQGYFEIDGVPEELIKITSKRRQALEAKRKQNDTDLKDDPIYAQMTEAEKYERANKDSRAAKDKDLDNDAIRIEIRDELEKELGYPLDQLDDEVKKKTTSRQH
jgi:conjugative relaxase-like TrwC/TraI family protein